MTRMNVIYKRPKTEYLRYVTDRRRAFRVCAASRVRTRRVYTSGVYFGGSADGVNELGSLSKHDGRISGSHEKRRRRIRVLARRSVWRRRRPRPSSSTPKNSPDTVLLLRRCFS